MNTDGDHRVKGTRVDLDVIVGAFQDEQACKTRSRLSPDTLVIGVGTNPGIAFNGLFIRMRPDPLRLLSALIALRGAPLENEDAWTLLWGDREDGGPDNPDRVILTLMQQVRAAAATIGFHVENQWGRGYRAFPAITTPALQAAE